MWTGRQCAPVYVCECGGIFLYILCSLTLPPPNISELRIPFPSSSLAQIALGSLAPDPEPRKEGISKELEVTEDILHVRWRADEARILRVSISSFLEHLSLVVETMDLFGPPVA
ncbi:EKC/KEOPS complex subunit LAGE3-like [Zootoca vivipara]|uniref:EKC/KEOPS complex subunit LAGE3-like n=1 Tax=Zootoca vivipara TaxID=8524 RepID=UPI00293B9B7D|nr:EKC/KEOPS complex subunit LAGE3-like [Zootoca vivipara]